MAPPGVVGEWASPAAAGRRLTLALLVAIFALNFMDRQIVAILAEPIKRDLNLSDTAVGLLYGLAFAVLYTTAGIPIARLADRRNRARIINASLVAFSLMSVACGLAATYWQLILARIGVAIGEGGTNPPSHSMISDLYPLGRRSTAMAVFSLGPHIGVVLGFLLGGWVAQVWGWRTAFYVAGAVGLVFAGASVKLLQDRQRGRLEGPAGAPPPPIERLLRRFVGQASLRHILLGGTAASIAVYAVVGWLPAFLMRSHGLGTAAAGSVLALILGLVGAAGTVASGVLADRLGARDAAWRLNVVAIALLVIACGWAGVLGAREAPGAIAALIVPGALLGAYLGPSFAMVQSLVEPAARATAAALLLFVANVIGLGFGPLLVGAISDVLEPTHGAASLGLALWIVPPLCLWAACHYHAASRSLASDLHKAVRAEAR
jgi:predicted MFS family arabinose efflux permease